MENMTREMVAISDFFVHAVPVVDVVVCFFVFVCPPVPILCFCCCYSHEVPVCPPC